MRHFALERVRPLPRTEEQASTLEIYSHCLVVDLKSQDNRSLESKLDLDVIILNKEPISVHLHKLAKDICTNRQFIGRFLRLSLDTRLDFRVWRSGALLCCSVVEDGDIRTDRHSEFG